MKRITRVQALGLLWTVLVPFGAAAAPWQGFVDRSDALQTDTFAFTGTLPEMVNSNENYYDGDFADFDGDGIPDRSLGARYGLLMNTGGGLMRPYAGYTNFLLRGMPGASGWGEDGFQWVDIDDDGDYDNLSGGNGEPLTLQVNRAGRFSVRWQLPISALNIVNTDVENDGDVDLVIAHAFCSDRDCGGPVSFALLINDGTGDFTDEAAARGLGYGGMDYIVGVASGDLDGDGDFDLVLEHGASDQMVAALNDGSGDYSLQDVPLPTTCSGFGQALNLGDVDDDGDLDIVAGRCGSIIASGHPDVGHVIGINDGAGGFTNESATRWDSAGVKYVSGDNAKLADLDHDGDLDFAALRVGNLDLGQDTHWLQVFLNDGSGKFIYDKEHDLEVMAIGNALGADLEVVDLDADGSYDLWLGIGGDRVRILMNTYSDPLGIAADVPRNVEVAAAGPDSVTVTWEPPPFAATARAYNVYRATAAGLDARDRRLVHRIGRRHQDEGFSAPLMGFSTPEQIADPNVNVDPTSGTITFVDASVNPGVTYFYSISHVGGENTESRASNEVVAAVASRDSDDQGGPTIDIVSPTDQTWWAYPRIVVHYADGGSGVDLSSLTVTFDAALGDPNAGGRAAGSDVTDLAYRKDDGVLIVPLVPPLALPEQTLATMTVNLADMNGNVSTKSVQTFVSVTAAMLPTADMTATPAIGSAPLQVTFDASASSDGDGRILRWEWYFGDGTTALGRTVEHTYAAGGIHDAMLLVRDNDGGVDVVNKTIDVSGPPPECTQGATQPCYGGPSGTEDVGECHEGMQLCEAGVWGACTGEVRPGSETCDDGRDDDCDGMPDDADEDCVGGTAGSSSEGDEATGGTDGDGVDATGAGGEGDAGATEGAGGSCGCTSGRTNESSLLVLAMFTRFRRSRSNRNVATKYPAGHAMGEPCGPNGDACRRCAAGGHACAETGRSGNADRMEPRTA